MFYAELRAAEVNRTRSTMWEVEEGAHLFMFTIISATVERVCVGGVRCRRLVIVMTSRDLGLCFIESPINLIEASLPVDQQPTQSA